MRASQSNIQQTLTSDAASVLNRSIAEAARRNHSQTTPLHVAATLLSSPSGLLRGACVRSHPNSSHPLQCRALELCFTVALERLQATAATSGGSDPPLSNALAAALKRAQANQRRGCPDQQQQPLLAVKVELEQLIISILDDPSVSRVMREASFSSPAVKATIEQSLGNNNHNSSAPTPSINSSAIGSGVRAISTSRNLYLNPRLQQNSASQLGQHRTDEAKRVIDIFGRAKKRNPVLVGDSEPGRVISEVLKKIETGVLQNGPFKKVKVIHFEDFLGKIGQLSTLIETQIENSDSSGVVLDLGNLKWLVEQNITSGSAQPFAVTAEVGRSAVAELRKLLDGFRERLWFIGTATCETYLCCQVYHPSMENDWDLQAVPFTATLPSTGVFPRIGNSGILSTTVEPLSSLKSFPTVGRQVYDKMDPILNTLTCCPQCWQNCKHECSKLEGSLSEVKSEAAQLQLLPQWLQTAKTGDGEVKPVDQSSIEELEKKWNETCLHLHPSYHQKSCLISFEKLVAIPISLSTSLYNPNLLLHQPLLPKLQPNRNLFDRVPLCSNLAPSQATQQAKTPPGSPVRTDLVLGRSKVQEDLVRDFFGCISSEERKEKFEVLQSEKLGNSLDVDLFKKLLKGLSEKVWWQHDAASAVAATVSQCKLGNGTRRDVSSKSDVWLLFSGPDRVGKKKMASTLSELVYETSPITVYLGSRRENGETNLGIRGKTMLDRIAETVRRSPFSVIILEDIDEADMLLGATIKRAMERGRLCDSHGREISLGNVIFVLTANWTGENNQVSLSDERQLHDSACGGWGLRLCLRVKSGKQRPSRLYDDEERPTKSRKAFDLNEEAEVADEEKADGSHNSSDVTIQHDQEENRPSNKLSLQSVPFVFRELVRSVDDAIVFKPVDFRGIRRNIRSLLLKTLGTVAGNSLSLEIQDEAMEKMVGGIWFGQKGLEQWIEGVAAPSFHEMRARLSEDERMIARIELDEYCDKRCPFGMLPSSIRMEL